MAGTLADRMKAERSRLGWSQEDLAAKVKIRQSFIGALEAEGQKNSKWLPEIAHALGVSAYWLKTGKGDQGSVSAPGSALPAISEIDAMVIDALAGMSSERAAYWRKKIISEAELEELERRINAPPEDVPAPNKGTSDLSRSQEARREGTNQ